MSVPGRLIDGSELADVLEGGIGADLIRGRGGADRIFGFEGDDTLVGGAGPDLLSGGPGLDTVDYSDELGGISADLSNAHASGGLARGDRLLSIERVIGTGFADLVRGTEASETFFGGSGSDFLMSRGGVDTLFGGAGRDVLMPGEGPDSINGGGGIDRVQYTDAPIGVTVSLTDSSQNAGGAAGDVISEVENLTGSPHDDVLIGSNVRNVINGKAGDDLIDYVSGGGGLVFGGDGDDRFIVRTIYNENAAYQFYGGEGRDTLDFSQFQRGLYVQLDLSDPDAALARTYQVAEFNPMFHTFRGIENIIGSNERDRLAGDWQVNELYGLDDSDFFDGASGRADLYDGGAGFDTVDFTGSRGGLTIDMTGSYAEKRLGTSAAMDRFVDIERIIGTSHNDLLIGTAGNDRLNGGAGDDRLKGGAGDDVLFGLDGQDWLEGGDGADHFFFHWNEPVRAGSAPDRISDFNAQQGDRLTFYEDFSLTDDLVGSITHHWLGTDSFSDGHAGRVDLNLEAQVRGDQVGDNVLLEVAVNNGSAVARKLLLLNRDLGTLGQDIFVDYPGLQIPFVEDESL